MIKNASQKFSLNPQQVFIAFCLIISAIFFQSLTPNTSQNSVDFVPQTELPSNQEESINQVFQLYPVTRIVDGDTIKVQIDDKEETVRLVNMNTPETVDPRKSVECMGLEASAAMKNLVEGHQVSLEVDTTQTDRDRYSRLLRFIFLEDGTDLGLQMIKLGFAYSTPYGSTNHQYFDIYEQAQKEARTNEIGLWHPEACVKLN